MIGTKLAHYEITSHIGSGGMGDVYQATDTKLGRRVAIKFLSEAFTHDAERAARFEREARVLASLNHSNIATIFGLEESGEHKFLVMELVGGETLAERIKRGPILIDESLGIAKQICEALEAAHEKGIIHRDLKPANVKITQDGKVKILDFGLAKVFESEPANAALSNSPTLSMAATNAGVILGTAAYMSPEQATGRTVDKRADIFAFGCVLYEMLTGHAAFDGEDIPEILFRVLQSEPDWTLLPTRVPPRVRELLRLCLEKSVKNRRSDAADVRIDLQRALEPDAAMPAATARGGRFSWVVATLAVLLAVALAVPAMRYMRETPSPEMRVEINTPATTDPFSFSISPDGRQIVFVASDDGVSRLLRRSLAAVAAQPLPGTEGATFPFWSPDSTSIGFFAEGKLKRIDLAGGRPKVIASAVLGRGGAWNRQGLIVFAPAGAGPLLKVPETGGEPMAVTRLENGQSAHKFPQFLPDGRHFIYFAQAGPGQGTYVTSIDNPSPKLLMATEGATAIYPAGFLLFARQTTLFAQRFDFMKQELSGNPFPIAEGPIPFGGTAFQPGFSTGADIVGYRAAARDRSQLIWLDRSGKTVGQIGDPVAEMTDVELSPDGKRVAVERTINNNTDIWLVEAASGASTRFTFDAANDLHPSWLPGGVRILFQSNRTGVYNLYTKLSSGAGTDELLLQTDQTKTGLSWTSDGRFLLFRTLGLQTAYDLWVLPMFGEKKPFPFVNGPSDERNGQFSPDGKWVVYQSNESGRFEIMMQPFPGPGGKFQISTNGGSQPRWNKNGREIFYISLDSKMMAAPLKLAPDGQSLERTTPVVLFPVQIAGGPVPGGDSAQYDVASDGLRFLVNTPLEKSTTSPITIIYNWHPEPRK